MNQLVIAVQEQQAGPTPGQRHEACLPPPEPPFQLPPRATARLQLHAGFPFAAAADQVDHFARIGVSHLYLSPIFCARPGSMHGYDVTDFGTINPELGGEAGFLAFAERARGAGLGLVLDIVPNHMAANSTHNAWWRDVLARGAESRYAHHFDIDWHSPDPDLHGKVLLPILAQSYWDTLGAGELKLVRNAQEDRLTLRYGNAGETDLPLSEESQQALAALGPDGWAARALAAGEAPPRERLHDLLERQHYRLAWWRTAAAELNWRRFFEVSDLVGVRVEDPPVFEDVHALVFRLYREGWIDGVRVDHVDGLADPGAYCRELRARLTALTHERPPDRAITQPWIVVEKILGERESLRADWLMDGTTGYAFMDQVGAVLHDGRGELELDAQWHLWSGDPRPYRDIVAEARQQLLHKHLVTEFDSTCRRLHACARSDPATRDLTLASLRRALAGLLGPLDVYRTYITDMACPPEDKYRLQEAAGQARAALAPDQVAALDQLLAWLDPGAGDGPALSEIRTRIQQLMPPLAAKAAEDTAFYRYGRLLSRNEVGSLPATLAIPPESFHARMAARLDNFPGAMLATATHDHKRGEDTRMRLAVLSEIPERWSEAVEAWDRQTRVPFTPSDAVPDGTDRYMLYQTILGAWPLDLEPSDRLGLEAYLARLRPWQLKSVREAKRHGSWTAPNTEYENGCDAFLGELALGDDSVLSQIGAFALQIAPAGVVNSLAQTLIQLTAPGVPDRYQGTEGWDFSLVDPDNRRPVDYALQHALLNCRAGWDAWMRDWRDGRIKAQLIRAVLGVRLAHGQLFRVGDYRQVQGLGPLGDNVLAFERQHEGARLVTVVTRHAARHLQDDVPRIPAGSWRDTTLFVSGAANSRWMDLLTGQIVVAGSDGLPLSAVLAMLPVALLMPAD